MKKNCFLSPRQKWQSIKGDSVSLFLFLAVCLAAAFTIIALLFIIAYILIKGIPNLTPELFAWKYNSENVSLMPALINTLLMTALSLLFAVPVGIGAAVWLTEYAARGNRLVGLVSITAETLSGIPSIVYGLFGSLFFAKYLGFGLSRLSRSLNQGKVIKPQIKRPTQQALNGLPAP